MQRPGYGLLIALATLPVGAHAQSDWIDEFPSVTAVAHAAFQELKVTWQGSNVDITSDDDSIAVNLAGTFNVLRQIMFLKYNAEPPMSQAREDKLRKLVAAYMEAELTIGQGAGTRRGYITRAPAAGGQGCRVQDQECYRRWFLAHLHANTSRAEYRERFLNRLFPCSGLAKELNDLRQGQATRMPYFPSPAVTLQVDPELAGLAPAGCTAYGGDANRNGLCDDWENVPDRDKPPSAVAAGPAPTGPIELTKVRLAQGGGLKVSIATDSARPGATACFRVMRVADPTVGANARPVWSGLATIESDTDAKAPLYAIVARDKQSELALTHPLVQSHPFLLVEILPGQRSGPSRGPVHCEQPLETWLPRHRLPTPEGLHGPYYGKDATEALRNALHDAGAIAVVNTTGELENGFLIMLDTRPGGGYYATPPRQGDQKVFKAGQPLFRPEDYARSLVDGFATSCEEREHFALAATVHTHPEPLFDVPGDFDIRRERADYFSWEDFDQAVRFFYAGPEIRFGIDMSSRFDRIFMISARTRCIQSFKPQDGDQPFTKTEIKLLQELAGLPRIVSDRYDLYWRRQAQVGCYKPKQ